MKTTFNFELFKKRLNLFLEKIEDLGGEIEPLTIEKPAIEDEIKAIEAQLGYTLPLHFREVLLENTAHLDFYWDIYHYPVFNVADIAICIGAGLLALDAFKSEKKKVKDEQKSGQK